VACCKERENSEGWGRVFIKRKLPKNAKAPGKSNQCLCSKTIIVSISKLPYKGIRHTRNNKMIFLIVLIIISLNFFIKRKS
jgi:hypothetical protein